MRSEPLAYTKPAGPTGCGAYAGTGTVGESVEPIRVWTVALSDTGTPRNQYCPIHVTMPLTATWPFTRTSICSFTPSVTPSTLASALPVRTTWIDSVVARGESLAPDGGRVPPIELWIRRRRTAEIRRRRATRERADRPAVRLTPLARTRGSRRSWDSVTTFATAPAASSHHASLPRIATDCCIWHSVLVMSFITSLPSSLAVRARDAAHSRRAPEERRMDGSGPLP